MSHECCVGLELRLLCRLGSIPLESSNRASLGSGLGLGLGLGLEQLVRQKHIAQQAPMVFILNISLCIDLCLEISREITR